MNSPIHNSKKCILDSPIHKYPKTQFLEIYKHHNGVFPNKNSKISFGTLRNVGVQEEKCSDSGRNTPILICMCVKVVHHTFFYMIIKFIQYIMK